MNSTGVKFFTGVWWALQGEVSCGTGCVVCFGALCEVCCGAGNEVFLFHGARFAVAKGHCSGPRMGSLKSPCTTSYWSSIETTAVSCLVFEKIAFCVRVSCDKQTDGHPGSIIA